MPNTVNADYSKLYTLPSTRIADCRGICKVCSSSIKYNPDSKGNLLKHYQSLHQQQLDEHLKKQRNALQEKQSIVCFPPSSAAVTKPVFTRQKPIEKSIARDLCARGAQPLTIVNQDYFRDFCEVAQPNFKPICYRTNLKNVTEEATRVEQFFKNEFALTGRRPNVTVDGWTAQNGKPYLGCTCHYVCSKNQLQRGCLFLAELPPPHTAEQIRLKFDDEIDRYAVRPFYTITDNAANMRAAFKLRLLPEDENDASDEFSEFDPESINSETVDISLEFPMENGCAAHLLQLVVRDGLTDAKDSPVLSRALSKSHKISVLASRSTHFKYALEISVPKATDVRWNSDLTLIQHIINNADKINSALRDCNQETYILKGTELALLRELVSLLVMFKEGTDLLQGEKFPTLPKLITTVQQLEIFLLRFTTENAVINTIKEHLLNGLRDRFLFVKSSPAVITAAALDPSVKLDFTEEEIDAVRYFSFLRSSTYHTVMEFLKDQLPDPQRSDKFPAEPSAPKQPRLSDFSLKLQSTANRTWKTFMASYLETSSLTAEDAIAYWSGTGLEKEFINRVLEVLSIPASTGAVERLFSQCSLRCSNRRNRIKPKNLEKLVQIAVFYKK